MKNTLLLCVSVAVTSLFACSGEKEPTFTLNTTPLLENQLYILVNSEDSFTTHFLNKDTELLERVLYSGTHCEDYTETTFESVPYRVNTYNIELKSNSSYEVWVTDFNFGISHFTVLNGGNQLTLYRVPSEDRSACVLDIELKKAIKRVEDAG